jgi:hypothetical protein
LHGRTKEDRHLKLSELKKEAEYIDSSLAKLG